MKKIEEEEQKTFKANLLGRELSLSTMVYLKFKKKINY